MNATQYTLNNNLHLKPICAWTGRAVAWASTTWQKNASETEWHGHLVRFLSKATLIAGSILSIPIALIEAAVGFAFGGIALAFNKAAYADRSEFLQKHSLKFLSYAVHSLALSVTYLVLAIKNPILLHYTANAVIDHAIHIGSAGFIQCTVGASIDKSAERSPQLAITRTLNLLSDSHPNLLNDIGTQIERDFDINIRRRIEQVPSLEEYLNRHPDQRRIIENFNIHLLLNNQNYRQQVVLFGRQYLEESGIIGNQPDQFNPLRFELNRNTGEESAYQEHLARLLKNSFLQIYRTPELYHCLDKDGTEGNDLLEMMDASTYVPLTTFTQYQELLQPLICPRQFSGNLVRYNQRRNDLTAAREQILALNEVQRGELVQKILRGADVAANGAVQAAYLSIHQLAPALYKGPLMTKTAINLQAVEGGGEMMDVRNLFQKACQDAIAEINEPPA